MTQVWDRGVELLEKQFGFVKVYYYVVRGGVNALQMDCNLLWEVQSLGNMFSWNVASSATRVWQI